MRRFMVLLKKELRELLTKQILLPFIVVIVMFVALGQTLSSIGGAEQGEFPLLVVDSDQTELSRFMISVFEDSGFEAMIVDSIPEGENTQRALENAEANVMVEIPEGFSAAMDRGEPLPVVTRTSLRTFSFVGNNDIMAFGGALEAVNSAIAVRAVAEAAPQVPARVVQRPVLADEYVLVGDREARTPAAAVMGFVAQQTTFIPIVLFIVIMFASQMIATAVATEKENKTLETLLSYPVSRTSIVASKMVAAGLIALLSAGAYMIGMQQYMRGIEAGLGGAEATGMGAVAGESRAAMEQLGLTFGAGDYALLGLTLFAGILVALSIAIILGGFAESVKSVQALLTPLMVLLLIPYFLTLFLDLSMLPDAARIAVMAIPFTYPFITGPNLFLGNVGIVWFGIAYQLVWFAVFVAIAARVFSSDRILTMKLSLGKKR